ncbi:MAG: sulfite exporter TauE/SafE family protein [Rhizorhabdus sp.]
MDDALIIAAAGLLAGGMNALAGGGSFVTLPALLATGTPSIAANATSTVALWPGGLASAVVYRDGLRPIAGIDVRKMLVITIAGGAIGAGLLLYTPERLFDRLLPWLALWATLALALAPRIGPWMQARLGPRGRPLLLAGQLLLGIYGGYYGGAVGLMMTALWSLIDGSDIKALAGARVVMGTAANAAAIACFALAGIVQWETALLLGGGALAGGYAGARLGRILPPAVIRQATLALCAAITLSFFFRAYF